ncbi:aquaporin-like protein [Clavulina sp. PMI_390]|nr:aquaporin-like protein [Clavulina sp. PMI_390]
MEKSTFDEVHPYSAKLKKRDQPLYFSDLPYKRYAWQDRWQQIRPQWLGPCAGEFFGVFCYCYAGIGAQAAFFYAEATNQAGFGSLFTIGAAYAIGIAFAVTTGGTSSGACFNPAFVVALATWRDFPWKRVPAYILAQLLGAVFACLVVYCQWHTELKVIEAAMIKGGKAAAVISASGPAGVFAFYPTTTPLKWVFANEFFADFFIGLVFWGLIDFTNVFSSPVTVPIMVGLSYAVAIWGFVPLTVALNPARDFGGRILAVMMWGRHAWGGKYSAIGLLTAFPATLFATFLYQFFLVDYSRVLTSAAREFDLARELRQEQYNALQRGDRRRTYTISGNSMQSGRDSEEV